MTKKIEQNGSNAGYKLQRIILIDSQFRLNLMIPQGENEMTIAEPEVTIDISTDLKDPSQIGVQLTVQYRQKVGAHPIVVASVTMLGMFAYLAAEAALDLEAFAHENAPAIMFPYIREHYTSLSQKAGLEPIYLQPVNFAKLALHSGTKPEAEGKGETESLPDSGTKSKKKPAASKKSNK